MQIENGSGVLQGSPIEWSAGPGLFHSTSAGDAQVVTLERLGGDGITWIDVGDNAVLTGNGVVIFDLDRCIIRLAMASGTNVFADITTRKYSA